MKIKKSQLKQIIKEEVERALNETGGPPEPEAPKKIYTIGEFRKHAEQSRRKVAAQKGAAATAKATLSLSTFGQLQSAQEFAKGFKELSIIVNNPGFKTPTTQLYIENPILHYIDFDPAYEAVLHGAVFDAFMDQLGEQLLKKNLDEASEMPDIDHMLEDWLKETGYNGHKLDLDGAVDANISYAKTAGPDDPHAGTPAKGGKSWWERAKELGKDVVGDPVTDVAGGAGRALASAFSTHSPGMARIPANLPTDAYAMRELKQIIKEEIENMFEGEALSVGFGSEDRGKIYSRTPDEPEEEDELDKLKNMSDQELLQRASEEFPANPSEAPPKIEPGSPEEEEYEKLMAPRSPVQPEEEQYSDQRRAEMLIWSYEEGDQAEISYKDYVDALLMLRKSGKHPHLQTHVGGKEV